MSAAIFSSGMASSTRSARRSRCCSAFPGLRNVAATAPYFHDGSAKTLPEAVKAMGIAQLDRVLSEAQIAAIVAFLNTLTGTYRGQLGAAGGRDTAAGLRSPMKNLAGIAGFSFLLALLTWLLLRGSTPTRRPMH